ncbi:hypothetical protein JOF48_003063 [Arthrobacter stackebrandtii]|uniref:DUF4192 domain-containing protein n=1 Tax=Arthrobacter stackebrandtii TaxID=272161 RepID=A0ABS4YZP0_9MICC|nr:DUF4192 domain-containing protein [Arthrobacter stackebrandtii]MBP2414264.1 hypothetical protein [Arthrobacter stackebrandtii]PYH01429.1 hypothetical protein CVV67_02690 [Arthrobacter stackebrandtii]
MKLIRISSPADTISYMGHSLGYWPQESLVCLALDGRTLGPTLRVNLPSTDDVGQSYAERVAHAIGFDHDATAVLIALFTHQPWDQGHQKPFAAMVQGLKRHLTAAGLLVHDVWIVGPESFATYDGTNPASCGKETPLAAIESCLLNAELVYQGSAVAPNDAPTIPELFTAVDHEAIEAALQNMATNPSKCLDAAYRLWMELIDHGADPTHDQLAEVLAGLQHVGLRDQILADMPGINEPMAATLFGTTDEAPQWDRIDSSEKLLRQLLSIASPAHAAAPLTMLGHICWWKGRGTAAANYMHVALTFAPDYHLARLLDQMLGAGVVSGWAQHKNTAYRNQH